jgi:hypothetical protein
MKYIGLEIQREYDGFNYVAGGNVDLGVSGDYFNPPEPPDVVLKYVTDENGHDVMHELGLNAIEHFEDELIDLAYSFL